MGFFDLFRPRWKHSNPELREAAVRDLDDADDAAKIAEVARTDGDARIRRLAVKKLHDPAALDAVGDADADENLRKLARDLATEIRVGRALAGGEAGVAAMRELKNLASVVEIAATASDVEVRAAALGRLDDAERLAEVVRHATTDGAREAALDRIGDADVIVKLAVESTTKEAALAALARIDDFDALHRVANEGRHKAVRKAAKDRIPAAAPVAEAKKPPVGPDQAALHEARRQQLCRSVDKLVDEKDPAHLVHALAEARRAWDAIERLPDEPEAVFTRFAKAVARAEERRTALDAAAAAHAAHVEEARKNLAERVALVEKLEALAGPDVHPSLPQIRSAWERLGAVLPEARAVEEKWRRALEKALARGEKHREAHAATVAAAKEAERAEAQRQADVVAEKEKQERDERRAARSAEETKKADENLAKLDGLVAKLEAILAKIAPSAEPEPEGEPEPQPEPEPAAVENAAPAGEGAKPAKEAKPARKPRGIDTRAVDKDVKALAAEAAKVGVLPRDKAGDARAKFQAVRDKIVSRLRELDEAKDWERWANLAKLDKLVARAEALKTAALAEGTDLKAAIGDAKKLQAEWKLVGAAPKDKSQAAWNKFRGALDEIFGKAKDLFAEEDTQRAANLEKKKELVTKAETLSTSDDWKTVADQLKALQAEWKTVGPTPKKEGDEVWNRFRAACDRFYDRRKAHFDEMDKGRAENLKRKQELADEAEKVSSSPDWKEALKVVKSLQADWKTVGPVPKADADAVWARFKTACDKVFEAARAHGEAQRAEEGSARDAATVQSTWKPATLADLLKQAGATKGEGGDGKPGE